MFFSIYCDHSEVDVFSFQRVGACALQDGEVLVVLFHNLVDLTHRLHRLHPTGHYHGTSWDTREGNSVINISNMSRRQDAMAALILLSESPSSSYSNIKAEQAE